MEGADDIEYADDVDAVELVDLRHPARREPTRPATYRHHPSHLSVVELRLAEYRLGCVDYAAPVRGLVVGQNPGRRTHPDLPLFPWPATSSAGRLVAMSGLTPAEYLGGLYRRNLVDDRAWCSDSAQRRARSILTALFDMPRTLAVVLCGEKVARAFGLRSVTWWHPVKLPSRQLCVVIPHPSGLNHVYNDESARGRTKVVMQWAALGRGLR